MSTGNDKQSSAAPPRENKPLEPWHHLRTGLGLVSFGVALLLVPVVASLLTLVASLFEHMLDVTLRTLMLNLARIAGVAGLAITFLGLALGFKLRRDHPDQKKYRVPLEVSFALLVGCVMLVAGTALLVRWFFAPDATRAIAGVSAVGLIGGALLGLAATWVLLGVFLRMAEAIGEGRRLITETWLMRGVILLLVCVIFGVAIAESSGAARAVSSAVVATMYTLTLGGGIWLSWRCARIRHHVATVAATTTSSGQAT